MADSLPTGSGVYVITNTINGKQYVGSTANLRARWTQHLNKFRNGQHSNRHLQAAYRKYGEAAFVFHIVEECDLATVTEREQHWIDTLDTVRQGYNIRLRAESNHGLRLSPEQCARFSAVARQRTADPQVRTQMAANTRASWTDPAVRQRRLDGLRQTTNHPAYRALVSERGRARLADPVERARMAARMQAVLSEDATRARFIENLATARSDPATEARRKAAAYEATQRSEYRATMRDTVRARLADPAYADRLITQVRSLADDPDLVTRRNESIRQTWQDPDLRRGAGERSRARWADPTYRERVLNARREARARREEAADSDSSE